MAGAKTCGRYQKLSKQKIEGMRSGGWVSALDNGKDVTLARDKFHERTASKDIGLILPKRLTDKNMQVFCQYVIYGPSARRNLIHQLFPVKEEKVFIKSKCCISLWLGIQEKYVNIFRQMISPKRPFNLEFRILTQPFTENIAKDGERLQILGRFIHREERKDIGEDLVKSYVKTMFCAKLHNVSLERISMQKKIIILFPSKKEKAISRQHAAAKEKESKLNVLAVGLVKTSSGDVEWS